MKVKMVTTKSRITPEDTAVTRIMLTMKLVAAPPTSTYAHTYIHTYDSQDTSIRVCKGDVAIAIEFVYRSMEFVYVLGLFKPLLVFVLNVVIFLQSTSTWLTPSSSPPKFIIRV